MIGTRAEDIQRAVLRSDVAQVSILSLGCVTQDWQVLGRTGTQRVILGYQNPEDYLTNPYYLGVIAGRVANRIGRGRFVLDGKVVQLDQNAPPHTLHGGRIGLGRRNWQMDQDGDQAVRLTYCSADGEDGFPGEVRFDVTITLDGPTLRYVMRALPDRPTPINLAQHSYYTLSETPVDQMRLTLPADAFTDVDDSGLPTGVLTPVEAGPWDFRSGRLLKDADPDRDGIDHNFVLSARDHALRLKSPSGLSLQMETDQPGVQVYTSRFLGVHGAPLAGQAHAPFAAVCLEPQNYPDAVNQPGFPDPIYGPDRPYAQSLAVTIKDTS